MKKLTPWYLGALLLAIGLVNFPSSILGGLLLTLSGLVMLPASQKVLVSKVPQISILENNKINYGLVAILFVLGLMACHASEKSAFIEKYKLEKSVVLKEIADLNEANEYTKAQLRLRKYLEVMPADAELVALNDKIKSDEKLFNKVKAENAEKAKLDASAKIEREEAEAKRKSEAALANVDLDLIGKCIGYLGKEIQVYGGPKNLPADQQNYLAKHNNYLGIIVNLSQSYPACFAGGANIQQCLESKGVSSRDIQLVAGSNAGVVGHKDPTMKAMFSLACSE